MNALVETTAPVSLTEPVPASALRRRPAAERGHADHGWLKSAHSFSFAGYHNPRHVHFHALRVINDDWVAGGGGFPEHPHRDFEIFSYVLAGALRHRDTTGAGSVVHAGGVQYMSAGAGVAHSEFNDSAIDPVQFLQIWLIPKQPGGAPRYLTRDLTPEEKDGRLVRFIAETPTDGEDAIATRAAADVYAATLTGNQRVTFQIREGRAAWVQVARGSLTVNGVAVSRGDGLAIERPGTATLADGDDAEILLFDLGRIDEWEIS